MVLGSYAILRLPLDTRTEGNSFDAGATNLAPHKFVARLGEPLSDR
jgi:hypothetical protein